MEKMSFEGSEFLKDKYALHNAEEVEAAAERTEVRTGEEIPEDPASRIQNYLDRFTEIIEREDQDKSERGMNALKMVLHDNFVITKEEIPEGYFDNQRRIAREQGHGDIEITDDMREQLAEVVVADQESSLDTWIDYLASSDATYPDWLKYYAFRSVLGMGAYDKEKHAFSKRSTGTTKPFPDLNREALAYVLDAIEKKSTGEHIDLSHLVGEEQERFEKLLLGENFAKLYAFAIDKVTPASKEALETTQGEWVKYDKGSDHIPLVQSLQGHGTGWCTAGESTAKAQLEAGDFYVFYSFDARGNPTIPRVAIRMHGNGIAEVRGIAQDQNLDPQIGDIVKGKLAEFPAGAQYEKKAEDMKHLTVIEQKTKKDEELTKEDLKFLYEVDDSIQGFGYERDPRIEEILSRRSVKADLSFALDAPQEKISTNATEALSGDILFHYDNLDLSDLTSAKGLKLPDHVGGSLQLNSLTSAEGLQLPDHIGGSLYLSYLTFAEGLQLPDYIGGNLDLRNLTFVKDLQLPDYIGGNLNLNRLTSAKGLKLPNYIGGNLDLRDFTAPEGLHLPDHVDGRVLLKNLAFVEINALRKKYPNLTII